MLVHVQGRAWPAGRAGAEPFAQVPGTNSELSGKEICRPGDNASAILPAQQVESWTAFHVGNPSAVFHGFTYKGCSQSGEATRGAAPCGKEHTDLTFLLARAHGCPHLLSHHLKHVPCFLTESVGKWSLEHRFSLTWKRRLPGPIYSTCQRVSIHAGRTLNGRKKKKQEITMYFRKEKIFGFFDSYLI